MSPGGMPATEMVAAASMRWNKRHSVRHGGGPVGMVTDKAGTAIEAAIWVYAAKSGTEWTFAVTRPPATVIGAVYAVIAAIPATAVIGVTATRTHAADTESHQQSRRC